jgi:hypothetical protein
MRKSANCFVTLAGYVAVASAAEPAKFTSAQTDLFAAPHAPSNAFSDFLTREGRKLKRIEGVAPRAWTGRALIVKF